MTDQSRSCKTTESPPSSAPPSGLGEGGQVTALGHAQYWEQVARRLESRVEELEAEREQLRKIADSVLLARLASSYHVMNAALDRLADHLHPEIADARALLKDGER